MKKFNICMFVAVSLFLSSHVAYAGVVFFGFNEGKVIKVMDLPNTSRFTDSRGDYVDVGYAYKQVTIFFIPIWNYDKHWVGYIGSDSNYLIIDKDRLEEIASSAGLHLPNHQPIPFWDFAGGKLLILFLAALYYVYRYYKRNGHIGITIPSVSAPVSNRITCPYCAELIMPEASVCKHCGKEVAEKIIERDKLEADAAEEAEKQSLDSFNETNKKFLCDLCQELKDYDLEYDEYEHLARSVGAKLEIESAGIIASIYAVTKGNNKTTFRHISELRPWFLKNIVPLINAKA